MVEVAAPLRSRCGGLWQGLSLALLTVAGSLTACGGESTGQLEPVELAFLIPSNFSSTGALTAGTTTGFIEFDLRRLRDDALITDPLNVFVQPDGRSVEQAALTDTLDNPIFVERAVVVLGNGLDENGDGIADPPPTSPPVQIQPMVPFIPPEGWQPTQTLAYTPNQTTVPEREPIPRFGVYVSSMIAFESQITVAVRDVLNQIVVEEANVNFPPGPTASVTVTISNATATPEAPLVIAICNQLGAGLLIGLKLGSTTTLSVPQATSEPDTPLNAPVSYITQAYQFDSAQNLLQVSENPASPGNLSIPLLDSSEATDGNAEVALISSTDGEQFACTGDQLRTLPSLLPGFF